MLFLPRSFFDASHFTWHRGWQKSHFGDFEHQFHVFVGYYIPNSWVMRRMRAFTNPFFIVFLSIHDLQHNVPYFSSNLPGTHLLDRGMVETTKKIISIANTGFVLLSFCYHGGWGCKCGYITIITKGLCLPTFGDYHDGSM